MKQASHVEVVDLGDAKQQTKGWWFKPLGEVHPVAPTRDPIVGP